MFDQYDGGTELLIHVEHEATHILFFLDVHARHRLIQKQHRWLCGERAPEFHTLLQTVGQPSYWRLADRLNLKKVDDFLNLGAVFKLFTLGGAPVQGLLKDAGLHHQVATGHQVIQYAHAFEQGDVLKRARNALRSHLVRIHLMAFFPLERNGALLRVINAIDHVQHRTLARAVGTDDRANFMFTHVEADV